MQLREFQAENGNYFIGFRSTLNKLKIAYIATFTHLNDRSARVARTSSDD